MSDIKSLIGRIEESVGESASYRDEIVRELPLDTAANQSRTAIGLPLVANSVAAVSGHPADTVTKFMEMIGNGTSVSEAAQTLGLAAGQAMDIRKALSDMGLYKTPGELAESLRIAANGLYHLAEQLEDDDTKIDEAVSVLSRLHLDEAVLGDPEDYLSPKDMQKWQDTKLSRDAMDVATAWSAALADNIQSSHPGRVGFVWGEVTGDSDMAAVDGTTTDGMQIRLEINMVHPEVPHIRFFVPAMDSVATMKLVRHDLLAPLGMSLQMVVRCLMANHFNYSELVSFKRVGDDMNVLGNSAHQESIDPLGALLNEADLG